VTQADSKIDGSKFYFCEKSLNFQAVGSLMAKAKKPNNCLVTSQNKAVKLAGK
jgi:hypothetical protein